MFKKQNSQTRAWHGNKTKSLYASQQKTAMIPQGVLGTFGAIKVGTAYAVAQFMLTAWTAACLYRSLQNMCA